MKTFYVQTLGCKVNHYEGEQIAALLRSHGLVESEASHADLRVVNTCSVTVEAAGKSRQTTRRLVRLPLLTQGPPAGCATSACGAPADVTPLTISGAAFHDSRNSGGPSERPAAPSADASYTTGADSRLVRSDARHPRVIVTGCWATSDPEAAAAIAGVDAVINHHADVAAELDRLLTRWRDEDRDAGRPGFERRPERLERHAPADSPTERIEPRDEQRPERLRNDGWIEAGTPAGSRTAESKAVFPEKVNLQIYALSVDPEPKIPAGTARLPLLGERQTGRQRAFLKVQDGCDAHCTYCIIPRLRPTPWSKPVADAVAEARRLVDAGHVEIVLTGVFLSAYGHDTALRRRRNMAERREPLAELVETLCTAVPRLRRLRLSSLEPGDLTPDLLSVLRSHPQVVPHFHLPLQSGSDHLLRRMNRQYTRADFLHMVDRVRATFDRPALTTDVIVAFPGETDAEFLRTLEVVDHAGFIHVHAFPYSPRPDTAAARWTKQFVPGAVANERLNLLRSRADDFSLRFRKQFVGQAVEVLVEREGPDTDAAVTSPHGRSERYFDVHFDHPGVLPGDFARVRVDEVTPRRTHGTCLSLDRPTRRAAGGVA
jgi:MiaB/RimO family radical SAM methylthiotransferase